MKNKMQRFILIIALTPLAIHSQGLLDKLDKIEIDSTKIIFRYKLSTKPLSTNN